MAESYMTQQAYLEELLALVDLRLEVLERQPPAAAAEAAHAFRVADRRELKMQARCEATVNAGGAAPLEYLFRTFALTGFERHCVYLALAAELDAAYETRYANLQRDSCRLPSLELCLQTFARRPSARAALMAQWRDRRETVSLFFRSGHRGIELQSDLTPGLKLDRRIPDFFFNFMSGDAALEGRAELFWPGGGGGPPLAPLIVYGDLLERMTRCAQESAPLLFYLKGEPGAGRHTLARHFCRQMQKPLLVADIPALLQSGESWQDSLLPIWREAAIRGAVVAFTGFELLQDVDEAAPAHENGAPQVHTGRQEGAKAQIRHLLERAARVSAVFFLFSTRAWSPEISGAPWRRVELNLEMPDTAQRILLWRHYLEGAPLEGEVNLDALAVKFALQPGQVEAAAREAEQLARWEGRKAFDESLLHQACRTQLSHSLGKKASRVNASYVWEDLILPPEQKWLLKSACAQVEHRHRVYDQWGFGRKVAYGRGLSMLFTGPPGTGKTMAAQVVANWLHLELYKVDLSGVLSKYVGETEKQLGAVFDEVKKSQSILFLDEADALLGKRTETKDSHDRYANVQTSYLLQKMEEYEGIVILASNFLENFDEAFKRRIKFIIDFPLPNRERREQIWRSVLPQDLPADEDIDFDFLARSLELSGSSIKNIAVSAAFLAAGENAPMGMIHLLLAAQAEQNKTGKSMGKDEFGEYYHQIQAYQKTKLGQE